LTAVVWNVSFPAGSGTRKASIVRTSDAEGISSGEPA
jgi:hypothetical protein